MIKIRNLSKAFGDNVVLDDISFDIKDGEVVSIIGSSGAGKSTLLRSINLLEEPKSGTIDIDDFHIDVSEPTTKEVNELRRKTAMVFQQFNLFARKTALENVMEGLVIVKGMPKEQAREIAIEKLNLVGMGDRINYYPKHLSGGQKQRVGIARALAMNPDLLLLDEPTSALDPELVGEVLQTIQAAAAAGNTMLLVSHEMNFVREVSDRIIFLEKGKLIDQGTPEEIFEKSTNPRTQQFLSKYYNV